jgi:hypothetical protein
LCSGSITVNFQHVVEMIVNIYCTLIETCYVINVLCRWNGLISSTSVMKLLPSAYVLLSSYDIGSGSSRKIMLIFSWNSIETSRNGTVLICAHGTLLSLFIQRNVQNT